MPVKNFAAFIGVDWSDKKHDVALQAADNNGVELRQVLEWFRDKNTLVFCNFLTQYSTLEAAQQAELETLNQFFMLHRCRYTKTNFRRIEEIKAVTPLTNDRGIIEPSQMIIKALALQLRTLLLSIEQLNQKIEQLFAQMPDADLFAALPGAGEHLAPRLLLAFGEERTCFSSAQELMQYAGIAPVTERSGKKDWVHWRWSCPKFLRQSFVEWAEQSRQHSFGHRRSMKRKSEKARRLKRQFGHWRLSGSELSGAVGRIGSPTMRRNTCWHSSRKGRHW